MRFYLQYDIIVINEDSCWIHLKIRWVVLLLCKFYLRTSSQIFTNNYHMYFILLKKLLTSDTQKRITKVLLIDFLPRWNKQMPCKKELVIFDFFEGVKQDCVIHVPVAVNYRNIFVFWYLFQNLQRKKKKLPFAESSFESSWSCWSSQCLDKSYNKTFG